MKQNKTQKETDVYIKDEGYADVKFLSLKAKKWAHENNIPNSLEHFGENFCGKSIWYPGMKEGLYNTSCFLSKLKQLLPKMRKFGLIIESEIDEQFI